MLDGVRLQLLCVMFALAACGPGATTDVRAPVTNQPVVEAKRVRTKLTLDGALAMMPEDTEMVLELDVAKLRQSAVWERIEPWLRQQGGEVLAEVGRLCDFDPVSTLDTVLMGVRGLGRPQIDATVFVRGFQRDASVACLAKASDVARERGEEQAALVDGDIVELREGTRTSLVLRFVDARTAILVSRDGSMIDRAALEETTARKPGEGLTRSAVFQQVLSRVDTHATWWLAMNGNTPVFSALPYTLRSVRAELHAGSDPARALIGTMVFDVGDANNASSMAQMFRMALDTLKGGQYDDIVQAVTVTDDGGDVIVELRLDLAQLERLGSLVGPIFP